MTTLRQDLIERDAPTVVEPPQGPYEVWALTDDGAARILTTDDEAHAQLTFRKQGHAVARGGVVLRFDVNLKPAQQRVLKHAVKHAPAPETAPETPPPPAEEVPAAHEEPVKTTEETTKDCTNCGEHPAAPPKDTTPKGEEGWCMHCRRNASIRRNRDAKPASVSQPRKKATKKPARKIAKTKGRKPKAPPSPTAFEQDYEAHVLDRVTRAFQVIIQLGGIERAEKIAEAHAFGGKA